MSRGSGARRSGSVDSLDAPTARRSPEYWRSLEEWMGSPEFLAGRQGEFPPGADLPPSGVSRRAFMKLLGASMALAGVGGCVEMPEQKIVPYAIRPPEVEPGIPLTYATTMELDGYGIGLLVQAREGRPIKVEGNPGHPASLGAAGCFEQASVLGLYDPARANGIRERDNPRNWRAIAETFGGSPGGYSVLKNDRGAGLRFLLRPTASPFRKHLIDRVRERFPQARFYYHSPVATRAPYEATRSVFGRPLSPHYDFARAAVIVAFDSDFLAQGPFYQRYAHDFAGGRRIESPDDRMNRLYVAEPHPTPTGSLADHRLRVRASEVAGLMAALAEQLGVAEAGSLGTIELSERARAWVLTAAADLKAVGPNALVVAGPDQPAVAHALAHLMNRRLGSLGTTAWLAEPQILDAGQPNHDLALLAEEIRGGAVGTLVVLDGNPAYTAPGDLDFVRLLQDGPTLIYLGAYENETAEHADWFIPLAHYLESWGDAAAYDGTISTVQPLIRPLAGGRSPDELLAVFAGETDRGYHELLRDFWRDEIAPRAADYDGRFDGFWEQTLQRGFVPDSAAPRTAATPSAVRLPPLPEPVREGIEVAFRADPSVYDGRFSNNGWLLELPDPTTKLTWGNAALMSPATLAHLGLHQNDVIRITLNGRSAELPVFPVPGHADRAVTLHLGYGRTGVAEETAQGVGIDVFPIRPSRSPSMAGGAKLERVLRKDGSPATEKLVSTQTHWSMEGRAIVLESTLQHYRDDPEFTRDHRGEVESLYVSPAKPSEHEWAMSIDLAVCTGCSACVIACQAENNIPIVGPDGVENGREMHWMRVDRYMRGEPSDPEIVHQPMPCQHCEHAPCEYVCPVNATVHSSDGLNEMIYNRCVGTRFCSNNCPYKVRRFNWFDYNEPRSGTELLVLNPDVTVRERGVMEKCSYCVQRIRRAQIQAKIEGRPVGSGEVKTACQQACPTSAIVFGNLVRPESEVSKSRQQKRIYSVLHELGTIPRTQYLARITNPNPALRQRGQIPEPETGG